MKTAKRTASWREGLMVVGHYFLAGREAFYRLTKIGRKFAAINGPWAQDPPRALCNRQLGPGRRLHAASWETVRLSSYSWAMIASMRSQG